MSDPYQVLGVSRDATDDEVTKAYRRMAKRYHPDINPSPDAEKKMQEVNAAYEQIQDMRKYGGQTTGQAGYGQSAYGQAYGQRSSYSGQSYGYGGGDGTYDDPFQGFDPFGFGFNFGGNSYQQPHQDFTDIKLRAASNYIQNQAWDEALHVLAEISDRNAQWYYLSALANAGAGNRITAMNHIQEAVHQEPGNTTYQALLRQFQQGNFAYQQNRQNHGFTVINGNTQLCTLCAVWAACSCCGRGCYGPWF